MDTSVEAVDGDIVLKFKKFLVEEGENEISASQKFIYAFDDTVGESSMLYLILTLMLGTGNKEPCLLL